MESALCLSSYNLGKNKLEQQTSRPQIKDEAAKPRKSQNAPFSHPWFKRGEGYKFPIYFLQDSSLQTLT